MILTVKDVTRQFLHHCRYEKNLSDKSLKAYQTDLSQFINFIDNNYHVICVTAIDKNMLREYIKALSLKSKPKTIKRKIATLKAFFNHIEFEDIIINNPFRKLRIKIKEGKQLPKTIALPKIIRLFKHVYDIKNDMRCDQCYSFKAAIRDLAVLELLFATGVRVAELCNLRKDDVDFLRGSLKVIGKENKERIIPVCNAGSIKAVRAYFELFKSEIFKTRYFFVNRLQGRLSEQSVRFMIRKYARAIKMDERITPHMFRHSIATLLLENGVDIRYIQTFLGHSSITTTQIYVQVNEEAQRKVILEKHPRRLFMQDE